MRRQIVISGIAGLVLAWGGFAEAQIWGPPKANLWPRGASIRNGWLRVSSIYDWFQDDFGGSEAGVLEHLQQYARGDLAERLKGHDGRVEYSYDWEINEP